MDPSGTVGNGNGGHILHKGWIHQRVVDLQIWLSTPMRTSQQNNEFTTELCIALLHIAKPLCQELYGNIFVVG